MLFITLSVSCLVLLFSAYIGSLTLRLVVVQPVEDRAPRWFFSGSFALLSSLFLVVLCDYAYDGGHLSAISTYVMGTSAWDLYHVVCFEIILGLLLGLALCVGPVFVLWRLLHDLSKRRRYGRMRRQRWLFLATTRGTVHASLSRRRTWWGSLKCVGAVGVCAVGVMLLMWIVILYIQSKSTLREAFDLVLEVGEELLSVVRFLMSKLYHGCVLPNAKRWGALIRHSTRMNMPEEVGYHGQPTPMSASASPSDPRFAKREGSPEVHSHAPGAHFFIRHLLRIITAKVAIVGVGFMGILSGYAAVMTPYRFLVPSRLFKRDPENLHHMMEALGKRQRYLLRLYAGKQRRVNQLQYQAQQGPSASPSPLESHYDGIACKRGKGSGTEVTWSQSLRQLLSRAGDKLASGGSCSENTMEQTRAECEGIRHLLLSLYLQLDEVAGMRRAAVDAEGWVGSINVLLGLAMGLHSVIKVVAVAVALAMVRFSREDPVTQVVNFLETTLVLRRRTSSLSPVADFSLTALEVSAPLMFTASLVLNAWMVVSSLRGLLLNIFHLTLSFSYVLPADTTTVVLAMCMAVYFVGQLVLLRQSLPPTQTEGRPSLLFIVLAPLPFYLYQRIYEWCFLMGCLATLFLHGVVFPGLISPVSA